MSKLIKDEKRRESENCVINIYTMKQYVACQLDCDSDGKVKDYLINGEKRQIVSSEALKAGERNFLNNVYGKGGYVNCLLGYSSTPECEEIPSAVEIPTAIAVNERTFDVLREKIYDDVRSDKIDGTPYTEEDDPMIETEIESPFLYENHVIDVEQLINNEMNFNGAKTREEAIGNIKEYLPKYIEAILFSHPINDPFCIGSEIPDVLYVTVGKERHRYYQSVFTEHTNTSIEAVNRFIAKAVNDTEKNISKENKMLYLRKTLHDYDIKKANCVTVSTGEEISEFVIRFIR